MCFASSRVVTDLLLEICYACESYPHGRLQRGKIDVRPKLILNLNLMKSRLPLIFSYLNIWKFCSGHVIDTTVFYAKFQKDRTNETDFMD